MSDLKGEATYIGRDLNLKGGFGVAVVTFLVALSLLLFGMLHSVA